MSDTINDLRDWRLGPYDAGTADRFLCALAASYRIELSAELRTRSAAQAEWLIPYHLQMIFCELREQTAGSRPTTASLDAAIERLLARRVYFSYWDERLRGALGAPDDEHARAILAACAADPRGATSTTLHRCLAPAIADAGARADAARWIIDVLVNDGYLVSADRRWRFRSGLLRRYWREHLV
jgi:hypothetical protein